MTAIKIKMITAAVAVMLPMLTHAMPSLARAYKTEYSYMPSCAACHSNGGGSELNVYGKSFKLAGKNLAAFGKISAQDSDGDGIANGAEATAKSNPADKNSTPGKPGNWLDIASLIPREVRAKFPSVSTWLPKDALLTSADIAAAKALGATLKASDENTIYIPLTNQRPVGTALIFPVNYEGKSFFLLMTTNRTLAISSVSVLHANAVPSAKSSKIFSSFEGHTVHTVPLTSANKLDAAISQAVKQASALLYVRLKGA